jgi:hypothetical protein
MWSVPIAGPFANLGRRLEGDLLLCGLGAWVSILFGSRFRLVTIVGAWLTFLLTLDWWANSPDLEVRGNCAQSFHESLSLHYGTGAGPGEWVCIVAAFAMIYGAHLRSRRIKLLKVPPTAP